MIGDASPPRHRGLKYVASKGGAVEYASEKLERIRQLWKTLETNEGDPRESEALMEKIRILSAEYQALAERLRKPAKLK